VMKKNTRSWKKKEMYEKAISVLKLKTRTTKTDVERQKKKMYLLYSPKFNPSPDAYLEFQKVAEAYQIIKLYLQEQNRWG